MDHPVAELAGVLRAGREEIVRRWLERIVARVTVDREFVFPSETLLDEVPLLIEGLTDFLEHAAAAEVSTNSPVVAKARELGRLRYEQSFSPRQILWEYEILGSLVLQYLCEFTDHASVPEPFARRLFHALAALQRASVEEYLSLAEAQVAEREERLRGFNRAVSHELRNDVGAILGAGRMLREAFVRDSPELMDRFTIMILDNGERLEGLLTNLLELSRTERDTRQQRRVLLEHAATEVARRLRGYAEVNGVRIELPETWPETEVNAATVDLALTNLISNGIKYARTDGAERWVRLRAKLEAGPGRRVLVEVEDNGRGVPEADRQHLFERFFRAEQTAQGVEGTGLGLSLVKEAVERMGGSVWAAFPPQGTTVFGFSLPARRLADSVRDAGDGR